MPDYKEMYFKLFRATEDALRILISAQRECEELYLSTQEAEVKPFPAQPENGKDE